MSVSFKRFCACYCHEFFFFKQKTAYEMRISDWSDVCSSDLLELFEAIARRRRAVRAFLPRCVDHALIERLVAAAATTPSSCNTQPWTLHTAPGMALDPRRATLTAIGLAAWRARGCQ